MRAIDKYMLSIPSETQSSIEGVNKYISAMELICAYSPEHDKGGLYESDSDDIAKYFGFSRELARFLDQHFFDKLYVERQELEEKIRDYIGGSNHLILLIGRVGVGKTVLLHKLMREITTNNAGEFIYLNLRKDLSQGTNNIDDYINNVDRALYKTIHDVILTNELIVRYRNHAILNEARYDNFRNAVELSFGMKLKTEEDIGIVLSDEKVQERLLEYPQKPNLGSILSFLVGEGIKIILCFDNVDKGTYYEQCELLYHCYQISEKFGIPVILAIRESNLQQVMKQIRDRRGDKSSHSSYIFFENLELNISFKAEKTKQVYVGDLQHPRLIRHMIERRFNILQSTELSDAIIRYRNGIIEQYGYTEEEFNRRFWEVFEDITSEFVEQGLYKFSNYNLRDLFVRYVGFTTTIMLNPEGDYRYDKLMLEPGLVDKTKLRTYLIKWLLANGEITPSRDKGVLNIYRFTTSDLGMIDFRVLQYIYIYSNGNNNIKLTNKTLCDEFSWLGIGQRTILSALFRLSTMFGSNERGVIWLDDNTEETINDNSVIDINPAGIYFIESLSVSREYAFWGGITADLPEDIIGRKFNLSDTYSDKFKLEVVAKLIGDVLIPACEVEIQKIRELKPKFDWPGATFDYYKEHFWRDGRCYIDHLTTSVQATIDHSVFVDESDRMRCRHQYDQLKLRIQQVHA